MAVIGLGFPHEPAQVALTLFTVGLPTFFLTRWAPPQRFDARMLSSLARFVGPASLITAAFAIAIYVVVHLFLAPPWRFFAGWTEPIRDKRPAMLVLCLLTAFGIILVTPPAAHYFALLPAFTILAPTILVMVPAWFLVLRSMWRHRLLERILDLTAA